jgi:uncharacterized protein (UPF0262 family)
MAARSASGSIAATDLSTKATARIAQIRLDDRVSRLTPEVERERDVAIADLLERNHFSPRELPAGLYELRLSIAENRLLLDISAQGHRAKRRVGLSLTPFRRVIKDYFLICESHYAAMKEAPRDRIEAVDMARRSLHDEGARLLITRLEGKVDVDFNTARRLFTLICALHMKG